MSSTVTAAEISKNFGAYQDAAVREPVIITKNGRPRTVLMAYEDFVRLSKRERRVQLEAAEVRSEVLRRDDGDEDVGAFDSLHHPLFRSVVGVLVEPCLALWQQRVEHLNSAVVLVVLLVREKV